MNQHRKWFIIISMGIMSCTALAGMDSGGGMIVKDSKNPWFLNNTDQVSYCIERDERHFPISEVISTEQILLPNAHLSESH